MKNARGNEKGGSGHDGELNCTSSYLLTYLIYLPIYLPTYLPTSILSIDALIWNFFSPATIACLRMWYNMMPECDIDVLLLPALAVAYLPTYLRQESGR